MDTCDPVVLIAVSLLRSEPNSHNITEDFRHELMTEEHKLHMTDFEVDQIWFHIRNEHKEWADFVTLHSNEKSFGYVRGLLFAREWEDFEVVERRPPTFIGLKRTMNDLIELDHHLETEYGRAAGERQKYKSRYLCPI
ncbi:hypothetical protein MMC17_005349 [Xylographa soralifera]|nr:hypothetical protein [Xylographa soralifera]